MYYMIPVPASATNAIRLYPSALVAQFLTPPFRRADGFGVFELSAPVAVDVAFDPDRGEVYNRAGAWASPATIEADDAIVLPVGTTLPEGLLIRPGRQEGWRDAPPVVEVRPPVVDPFAVSDLDRYLDTIRGESR